MDCERQASSRAKEICRALERALEWTWTGHAIISPSFRIGFEGIRHVYCTLPVTHKDTELLVTMDFSSASGGGMKQAQINNAVGWLLSMLGQEALKRFPDPEKIKDEGRRGRAQYLKSVISLNIEKGSPSIFSPSHKNYILRGGCRVARSSNTVN